MVKKRLHNDYKKKVYDSLVSGNYELGEAAAGEYLPDNQGLSCLSALLLALQRDLKQCEQRLSFIQEEGLSEWDYSTCLEARVVVAYFSGNFSDMEKLAEKVLELNQDAFFARLFLARLKAWKRDLISAIALYRMLLEQYPQHSSVLLDLAEALIGNKGNYREILEYVRMAKWSYRRNMYLLLIPLGQPFIRLVWVISALAIFSIPQVGTYSFMLLSLVTIFAVLMTLIKIRLDTLIISRLIFLQIGNTLLFLLIWFVSKYW